MSKIKVNSTKPRKEGLGLFTLDGNDIYIGKDWALQSEIDEANRRTRSRACFKGCGTCGCCVNSRRGTSYPYRYDANAKKLKNCNNCEPFRFHDCNHGWMRDSRQEAEPFTDDVIDLIKKTGGKPYID